MATTRIIAMHRNKGCTVEQVLKVRLDYIKNPEKTREGELVTAFACHAATADAEFALARKEYFEITGRWQKKTPASFISACDRFHYLDVLLSERIRSSNAQKAAATGFGEQTNAAAADDSDVKSGRDKAEVAKTISDLVAEHSDEAGWYFLGELGSRLQSRYPDFDSRNFGYAKLSDFVRSLGAYEFRSNVNPYNKNLQLVYIRKKEE